MRKLLMLVLSFAIASITATALADLPRMKLSGENKFLKTFQIDGTVNKEQIYEAYGAPAGRMEALPGGASEWIYDPFSGSGKSCSTSNLGWGFNTQAITTCGAKTYTFKFKDDAVVDVIVKYPGALFKPRSATKKQR